MVLTVTLPGSKTWGQFKKVGFPRRKKPFTPPATEKRIRKRKMGGKKLGILLKKIKRCVLASSGEKRKGPGGRKESSQGSGRKGSHCLGMVRGGGADTSN